MGKFQHFGFLLFFIFQTFLVFLFFLPMWTLLNVEAGLWSSEYKIALVIAAIVMVIAFTGEQLADQQLYRFKLNPENHGKTMDQGLWRYSRHPNYFFEWLHWFAYPIIGLAADEYLLWIYPVLMWLFLYYVTGIPFSEKQAIKSRGQNYLDYQQRTSMFIPKTKKIGAHMDFIVHQSLKIVESGVIPDHAIRAAIRALSKKRLIQEGRYDPEQGHSAIWTFLIYSKRVKLL